MFVYYAVIDALSALVVHINLNTVFWTHVQQSSLHKVLFEAKRERERERDFVSIMQLYGLLVFFA